MTETLGQHLAAVIRMSGQAFAAGDQVAPTVVLWPDPERLWEGIVTQAQELMPELYVLGEYAPDKRTGPALWLRCIEARVIDCAPNVGTVPIFYLPGIGREQLCAVEDCPLEIAALVELQYRGIMWLHVNGKEWTPNAFLVSKHGGLGLDVAKDQSTSDALSGALPALMVEAVHQLQSRRLNAEFFNGLVAPDATGLVLRWLSDPEAFKKLHPAAEWKAFAQQCKTDFMFDPVKDGPLKAAKMLAERGSQWGKVWQRFADSPANYSGVVEWLKRAAPKDPSMFDSAEVWPELNERDEHLLKLALESLVDRPQDEVIKRVLELEGQHAARRAYPWQRLGLSSLATALKPLAELSAMCKACPGAPSPDAYAEYYACEGWRVDAAAMATMAVCSTKEQHSAVLNVLRAIYLPWLEGTARHLQQLVADNGCSISKRAAPIEAAPGRLVMFADGLRLDVARQLAEQLAKVGVESSLEWEWSTIPSVTASAKPAASPLAGIIEGGEAGDEFATRLAASGQRLTQDRFVSALKGLKWQCLGPDESGDPSGSAWTEAGALDKRGHNEGWKLARSIEGEVRDLTSRIRALLKAGWTELIVVTDHGWLLLPGGLPKVELKAFLAEHRWGRCAAMKTDAKTSAPAFKWHWNHTVTIASPPGAGCFRSSTEYSHGGISLQEMVTPCLRITAGQRAGNGSRLVAAKWTGAKCRVSTAGDFAGTRVDVRTSLSDASTSLLSDRQAREVTPEGKVTIYLEDDGDIGKKADVVLLDAEGLVIDSLTTILGA
jgi:hypothetical protein